MAFRVPEIQGLDLRGIKITSHYRHRPKTMFLNWLKRRRRARLCYEPFPDAWQEIIRQNFYHDAGLSRTEQAKLRDDLRVLVAEKHWEGCGGLEMTDEIKVTIAAAASLLVLGFQEEYFDAIQSILVYPDAYVAKGHTMVGNGLVLEGDSPREGEAWYRGPIVLSWADVLASGRRQAHGRNVVLHEFAHQLDMQNGRVADGMPLMRSTAQYERWQEVVQSEYQRLCHDCRQGRPTVLDCYGAESLSEFFAVSTECFFERPRQLHQRHPQLYEILSDFYRQDPRQRS